MAGAITETVCPFEGPEIVALPAVTDQLYEVIPAGAEYVFVEPGQTLLLPEIEQVGKAVTAKITVPDCAPQP